MKFLAALCGVAGSLAAICFRPHQDQTVRVIILGNHQGYLSPCGCSSPMLGGILRQASVVRALQKQGPSIVLDSGNISGGDSEQEVLKAGALIETLQSLHAAGINLSYADSKFGSAELNSLQSLSGNAFLTGSVEGTPDLSIESSKQADGFLIGGVSLNDVNLARQLSGRPINPNDAVRSLASDAKNLGFKTILMVDGSKERAAALARDDPRLNLIVYNSASKPAAVPAKVGNTLLVSPGERGEYLLELAYAGEEPPTYLPITLGEDIADDAQADRFYRTYLNRIEEHHLWENLPRRSGKPFAGSFACSKCHAQDYQTWRTSDHAKALRTLIKVGHDKDPECLRCHVTGADVKTGFRSLQTTPNLGLIGCESCHGPAAKHAANPYAAVLPKVKPITCGSCHEQLNSPNFNYSTYWARIKHGTVEKGWKGQDR